MAPSVWRCCSLWLPTKINVGIAQRPGSRLQPYLEWFNSTCRLQHSSASCKPVVKLASLWSPKPTFSVRVWTGLQDALNQWSMEDQPNWRWDLFWKQPRVTLGCFVYANNWKCYRLGERHSLENCLIQKWVRGFESVHFRQLLLCYKSIQTW